MPTALATPVILLPVTSVTFDPEAVMPPGDKTLFSTLPKLPVELVIETELARLAVIVMSEPLAETGPVTVLPLTDRVEPLAVMLPLASVLLAMVRLLPDRDR